MMVISPDEGGMSRAIYIANVLGLDMGMFYKRAIIPASSTDATPSSPMSSSALTWRART